MATTSAITGRIVLPDNVAATDAVVRFVLSGFDTDRTDGNVVANYERFYALEPDGDLPPGAVLWRNTEGLRGTYYTVSVIASFPDQFGGMIQRQERRLGNVQIGNAASHDIGVLLDSEVPEAVGTFWSAITEAQYLAALDAATRAETAAAAAALYDGPTVNTFTDLASVTPAQLAVGDLVRVIDIGAAYRRVASGGHLDYSGSGGVRLDVLPGLDGIDVRAFGAVCDGISDDTAAFQSALLAGSIFIPKGTTVVKDTTAWTNLVRSIRGVGDQSRILFSPPTARRMVSTVRTAPKLGMMELHNVLIETDIPSCGTGIYVEETRVGVAVMGAVEVLRMTNVKFEAVGSGYWTTVVHSKNAGGVVADNFAARNGGLAAAQADPATRCFWFENDNPDYSLIRSLYLSNYWIERFNQHIRTDVFGSFESLYLQNGEMVGGQRGIYNAGPNAMQAVSLGNCHMDMIENCIRSDGPLNILRLNGADLRLQNNGALAQSGAVIYAINGNYWNIAGSYFAGFNSQVPGNTYAGIQVSANIPASTIVGNTFKNLDTGVLAPSATDLKVSDNAFQGVTTPYNLPANDTVLVDSARAINMADSAYSGDLDGLAGAVKEMAIIRLGSGFTSGPAGLSGAGHVVITQTWDASAAYQEVKAFSGRPLAYYRRKTGGVWGPWQQAVSITASFGQVQVSGNGSPEGVITGARGSVYYRADGGAGTTLYVKESGTGNTGWVAK